MKMYSNIAPSQNQPTKNISNPFTCVKQKIPYSGIGCDYRGVSMKDKEKKKDKPERKHWIDFSDEIKRLNRVTGQIEGIQKMLAAGRKLDDIITQCKAVHSAIASVEQRVFKLHLDSALNAMTKIEKKKNREEVAEELEALFKKAT